MYDVEIYVRKLCEIYLYTRENAPYSFNAFEGNSSKCKWLKFLEFVSAGYSVQPDCNIREKKNPKGIFSKHSVKKIEKKYLLESTHKH